jgi:hypothetical protein
MAPRNLKLGTKWRCVVNFMSHMSQPLCPRSKDHGTNWIGTMKVYTSGGIREVNVTKSTQNVNKKANEKTAPRIQNVGS